jgi:hypothetical protein
VENYGGSGRPRVVTRPVFIRCGRVLMGGQVGRAVATEISVRGHHGLRHRQLRRGGAGPPIGAREERPPHRRQHRRQHRLPHGGLDLDADAHVARPGGRILGYQVSDPTGWRRLRTRCSGAA